MGLTFTPSGLMRWPARRLGLKAGRGDLHTSVAVAYVRSVNDRLEKDPNRRVQKAIDLVFRKFDEVGSVLQVAL